MAMWLVACSSGTDTSPILARGAAVRYVTGYSVRSATNGSTRVARIAGMMHVTRVGLANPYELVGGELDVIAAVVLGGASIFGGSGSVTGTVLGVVLITLVKNSLILLGVPSTWQRFAVGLLLLVGIMAQALSARLRRRGPALAPGVAA